MPETIVIALLSLAGTLLGSLFGILTANKLTNYRIEQLEKKVEKHNNLVERVYQLEKLEAVMEGEMTEVRDHVKELEQHHK